MRIPQTKEERDPLSSALVIFVRKMGVFLNAVLGFRTSHMTCEMFEGDYADMCDNGGSSEGSNEWTMQTREQGPPSA